VIKEVRKRPEIYMGEIPLDELILGTFVGSTAPSG
jgi:hypothetical protein